MISFLSAAGGFLVLFLIAEYLKARFAISGEFSRKLVHIIAAVMASALPYILTFNAIIGLSILFTLVLVFSKKINFFSAIHGVKRRTYGEIYFPIVVGLMALLFRDKVLYANGILIMGISDGLASLVGQKYGVKKFKILSNEKSYGGSLAFLLSAAVICIGTLLTLHVPLLPALFGAGVIALILTLVEASLSGGLDNLAIPLVSGGLVTSFSYLFNFA